MKYSTVKHLVAGDLPEFVRAANIERLPIDISLTVNKKFYERIFDSTITNGCASSSFSTGSVNEIRFSYGGFRLHIKRYEKKCRAQFLEEKNDAPLWADLSESNKKKFLQWKEY